MSGKTYTLEELRNICVKALTSHNTSEENALVAARALVAAQADGLGGHGLSRLPSYCGQAASGKVDGHAVPQISGAAPTALRVDARHGFGFPALALAIEKLAVVVPKTGIAAAAVTNSHHCGAAGYHVEALARRGFLGILFANTPKAMAPWGGRAGVFGTNPIAFAAPRRGSDPLVIDLSLSKVARGKIMAAGQKGETIPKGWALDKQGRETSDPAAALEGTMVPMGDAKGAALALMVEILAAALTSANFGYEASSFFTADGPPPSVGQLLIAFDPTPFSGGAFEDRLEALLAAILNQEGCRLPGDRRLHLRRKAETEGVAVSQNQEEQMLKLANML